MKQTYVMAVFIACNTKRKITQLYLEFEKQKKELLEQLAVIFC